MKKEVDNYSIIDKMYWYIKYPNEAKCQYILINVNIVTLNDGEDPKVLIKSSNNMQCVSKNFEEYNPGSKCKVLVVFDNITADMINNKKLIK